MFDRDTIILVVDIICITILGVVLSFSNPTHPDMFYSIFGLLGTIAGAAGRTVIPATRLYKKIMGRFK